MRGYWKSTTALLAVAAMIVFVAAAAASSKVSNGNFERGDLSNWNVATTGGATWSVYSGNQTPILDIPFDRPPQGSYAAVAEEVAESLTALYRQIGLGTGKTQQISFYVYYRNYCGDTFVPFLQEYRIDIQPDGADPLSTDPADVLKTLFVTENGDPSSMSPKLKTYKLGGLSGKVQLRFLVSVACDELNAGTDNVKVGSAS
jgi:hypothetical protein